MLNRLIAAAFLVFLGLTSAVFFTVALLIWILTVPVDRRLILLHLFSSFWASLYLWAMPAWCVQVGGRRREAWRRNYVIVSNHQSQLDILVAFRLFIPFKWVSKAEVFKLPFIGWNMWLNRYIRLKRGDKAGVAQMFADCERALSRGNSIFIFPEGTRSKTGAMKPFRPGAFILAKKMAVPILPVVISGTNAALPKHSLNFHGRQQMVIRILDPIPPEQFNDLSVEALSDRVHAIISDALKKMAPA
ncbi:1-acyl-sn-glycerol-3-phosphate acyltransferase [Desulfosarcina alkanivorans]|uniref:1-acyl-sn-glycerol-3-phosphate acyltransferase n=1 Tax=Desulfosarcina alkanivorans TaxID=571177 RepID=A0A5K7YMQ3_9BACT|nr:lysophospholipid acyltransferase family protein [Desulfosarcina alkanivorans]BBO69540.1 1-acyl-sn-glycerol-3-phosphate acyltransferase [Desulfosarcina alkanivorans]